jgi:thioesterase domain-containing protein
MTDRGESKDEIRNRRLEKLRFWRRACADESDVLKTYNMEAAGNPLILFHGDFDMGGLYVRRLAMESNYPIVALAPQGLHDNNLRASVKWMARERLNELLAFKPSGPYRLGGYCNGALVAYEAALMLKEMGHEVEIVVMIEPSSLNAKPFYRRLYGFMTSIIAPEDKRTPKMQRRFGDVMYMAWNIGRVAHLSVGEIARLARYIVHQRATRRKRLVQEETEAAAAERRIQEKNAYLRAFYTAAIASYLPPPVATPVVVLSTGRDGGGRQCGLYDGTQWSRLASNFRHIQLPGHHSTCLSLHAGELAFNLSSVLRGPLPVKAPPAPPQLTLVASNPQTTVVERRGVR